MSYFWCADNCQKAHSIDLEIYRFNIIFWVATNQFIITQGSTLYISFSLCGNIQYCKNFYSLNVSSLQSVLGNCSKSAGYCVACIDKSFAFETFERLDWIGLGAMQMAIIEQQACPNLARDLSLVKFSQQSYQS